MPKDVPDLIPNEFGESEVTPPVRYLRVQRDSIPRKTNGLIEAVIRTVSTGASFEHIFYLSVPSLDDYTYHLLTVQHPIDFYPLEVLTFVRGPVRCVDED